MSEQPEAFDRPITVLDFDPQNPRFLDTFGTTAQPDAHAIERMLDEENIHELVGSIGQRGYFPGEPLLVTPNRSLPGRFIVVEGNRRLAALRLLNGLIPNENLPTSLMQAIQQAENRPEYVACLCFNQRENILRYLGFRHISGPRRWEPLSKARYLADLIANFYHDLEPDAQMRAVAKDIGSRKDYAAQLLTALKLYDLAKNRNYFGLQRLSEKDISFSLITTALSYRPITDFLGLVGREDCAAQNLREDHLQDLFAWMFAQDQQGDTILGESRKLRLLAAVVSSDGALTELRKTKDLDRAYVYTSGPAEALTKLLDEAATQLKECSEMVIGDVAPDDSHLSQINRIFKLVDNLQLLIERGIKDQQRSRNRESSIHD